jgi:hypothetical protein
MAIWYTLWPFALFSSHFLPMYCGYLLFFPHVGILYQEKSGNPEHSRCHSDTVKVLTAREHLQS